jgi:hypothetical protein
VAEVVVGRRNRHADADIDHKEKADSGAAAHVYAVPRLGE